MYVATDPELRSSLFDQILPVVDELGERHSLAASR